MKNLSQASEDQSQSEARESRPLAETQEPRGGTYFAFANGRVGRITPSRLFKGYPVAYESVDTTGYSKGKSSYSLKESRTGYPDKTTTIGRKDVMPTISRLKQGSTRQDIYKSKK